MVVFHIFQDIIDVLPQSESFSLPTFKRNPLKIEFTDSKETGQSVNTTYHDGFGPILPFAASIVYHAMILHWRRLTALEGDCKAVYEVTFDVGFQDLYLKAGDTIGVIPHNDESDVDLIISHLNLDATADLPYTLTIDNNIKGSKIPPHVPVKSTIRHVLTHCVDLRSLLKKAFLLALSKYTKNDKERKLLEYLCSKEGSAAYSTHILDKNVCVLDIFTTLKSCKPPVEVILAHLPRLLPRPYSIVNSGVKNDNVIRICFSVMTNNNRKGLTTGWLENLILNGHLSFEYGMQNLSISSSTYFPKEKVPIFVRKNVNMFCLPTNLETPLILIGPGTGVSPFIGFLEERESLKESNPDIKLGKVWLFFGCRNPVLDFIYEEELNGFLSRGTLDKLFTAFSRVEDHETKYIQDAITQNGKEVTELINDGAAVFVCGDLKTMAAEIKEILIKCFVEHHDMTVEDAQKKISEMQKDKRYVVDAWS
ncbi:hypothetical protein PYW07_003424 [Mythimna separata]|uniref:Methionine synthase reductase n=1 Tax=Mythimna separata TaxID=271217 RepID=A0AAD7YI34_MYTSE|nr:hypothetical protein PYW07_003424 [Mythimna separata]